MSGALAFLFGGAATGGGGGGMGPGGLTATIGPGAILAGPGANNTFAVNTCVAAGGTGPYSYLWGESDDGIAVSWTPSAATAAISPHVAGVDPGNLSLAQYSCLVTDSLGHTAISNVAGYGWQNTRGGIPP